MRKLALSVAVALSSFFGQPALAVEFEELYFICKRSNTHDFAHSFDTPNKVYFISINNDQALIYLEEVVSWKFKEGEQPKFEKIKNATDIAKPKLHVNEFSIKLDETRYSPLIIISRLNLELVSSEDGQEPGLCEIVDESVFKKRLDLAREYFENEIDSEIEWYKAEYLANALKKLREYEEKLSKRKF